jgi:hypothetical protein
MNRAIEAGAVVLFPAQSCDNSYPAGRMKNPFGYVLMIEAKL